MKLKLGASLDTNHPVTVPETISSPRTIQLTTSASRVGHHLGSPGPATGDGMVGTAFENCAAATGSAFGAPALGAGSVVETADIEHYVGAVAGSETAPAPAS